MVLGSSGMGFNARSGAPTDQLVGSSLLQPFSEVAHRIKQITI
jgi:hypothetical protein